MAKIGYTTERWEEINKCGDLEKYCAELSKETGASIERIKDTFKECVDTLTPLQSTVVSMYYISKLSKVNIQYALGKPSVVHIERILDRADKRLKMLYKIIAQIKNVKM